MPSRLIPIAGLIGAHQALHYDLPSHRITVSPAPQIDEVLQPEKQGIQPGRPLVFTAVSDIAISSQDNVVIGQCLSCAIEPVGERHRCRMTFDDFGTEISVSFTFLTLNAVPSPPG